MGFHSVKSRDLDSWPRRTRIKEHPVETANKDRQTSMSNHPYHSTNVPLRQRLSIGLEKISTVLKSQAWHDASLQGLSPTQGKILALLHDRSPTGVRLSEVADVLGITPPTASDAVTVLKKKGLVDKQRSPDDARAISITLLPKGQEQAEQVGEWSDFLLSAIDELTEMEQEIFLKGLIKIIQKLQAEGYISVTRMCLTCQFFHPHQYPDSPQPHHCGFVDGPFGDRDLRIDCPDQLPPGIEAS